MKMHCIPSETGLWPRTALLPLHGPEGTHTCSTIAIPILKVERLRP